MTASEEIYKKKKIDDFLVFGRHGVWTAILIELTMFLQCGNLGFMIFGGAEAKITSCNGINNTAADLCSNYHIRNCVNQTIDSEFYSINAEWSFFCQKAGKVKESTSYQMIGLLVGSGFWGRISDVHGRRTSMLVCLICSGIFGIASAFSTGLLMFTVLRSIVAFFTIGAGIVANTFFGELFPSKYRQCMAFLLNWSPNLLLVAGVGWFSFGIKWPYLAATWRTLAIVVSITTIPATVIMWFIDETPHYLLRSGQSDRAMEVIQRFYKINGKEVNLSELHEVFAEEKLNEGESKRQSYSFLHIFCTPRLIAYTLVICFSNFDAGFISYSLMFNLERISGSLYQNLMFIGLFRYGFNLLSAFAEYKLTWLGRKLSHQSFCVLTMLALLISITAGFFDIPEMINRICLLITAAILVQLFAVLGIICNEIFPTPLRNTSFALSQVVESFAPILAPHLYSINPGLKWFPQAIMITCVIIDFVVFGLIIPESRGKPLVDKMPENSERFKIFRDRKIRSICDNKV